MNKKQDSDDDGTGAIGGPRPPTPPKTTKLLGPGRKDVHLKIDTGLLNERDEDSYYGDNSCCYCFLCSCLICEDC